MASTGPARDTGVPRNLVLSLAEARAVALRAQGLDRRTRKSPAARADVRGVLRSVGAIQIDSVSAVARAQYIAPFARLGTYDRQHLDELAYRRREAFEHWGHEASLLPVELQPLFRWRMARAERGDGVWKGLHRIYSQRADYVTEILHRVRDTGPLSAADLDDGAQRSSPWWGWSDAKRALEWLFRSGRLMRTRNARFEIAYDLPERVLPAAILETPTPPEDDAQRALVLRATRALAVGTAADVADYFRMPVADTRARLAELVEAGLVLPAGVESWSQQAFLHPDARTGRGSRTTLLSPFDSLVWDRDRTERLFGFRYRIEIYTPAAKREFGYYVLPLLHEGRLVARVDVRADRASGRLLAHGAFAEAGEDPGEVADALGPALDRMAGWLGLESTVVASRGDVGEALAARGRSP